MGISTFANTSATLTLSTGFELALDPLSDRVVKDIQGWHKPAGMRRAKTDRVGAHGSFSERGWKDERLVSVTGHFYASTRSEAAAFVDEIAAFLADGTAGTLTVSDPDLGERWATVFLSGTPDVVWDGGTDVVFVVDLSAPDPRKYGQTVTVTTGPPADGGGLAFPLFTEGRGDLLRENLIPDPSFEYGTPADRGGTMSQTQYAYSTNPDGAGGTRWDPSINAGVLHGANALRLTVNGTDTLQYRYVWSGIPVTPGDWLNFAFAASTNNTAAQVYASVFFVDASGASLPSPRPTTPKSPVGQSVYTPVTLTLGAVQVPAGAVTAKIPVYLLNGNGTNPLTGAAYIDSLVLRTGATADAVSDVSYFAGDFARDGFEYEWAGTPGASTSREYALPADGTLYFGAPGDAGTATFVNTGTADSAAILRVDGYANGFTITESETGRRLVYTAPIPAGQFLILNPNDGTVKLNGYADRSEFLTVREWTRTEGGASSTFFFQSGSTARLTVEGVSAWW